MRNIFKKKIMKIFNFYGSGNNKLSLPLLNIILELYQTAKISFDRYSAQKQNGKDAIGSLSSLLRHDLSQYIDIRGGIDSHGNDDDAEDTGKARRPSFCQSRRFDYMQVRYGTGQRHYGAAGHRRIQ